MHAKMNSFQIRKVLLILGGIALFLLGSSGPAVADSQVLSTQKVSAYYTVTTVKLSDGNILEENNINGPPAPPPGFEVERQTVSLPEPDSAAGINILEAPAFNWVFGCSAVSGAMIAGYYDRTGWPNMYSGPTNGGVMPLDNSSWPTWSDGYSTYPNCPLIASKNGVDGRTTCGSIDAYWVKYGSSSSDPYITNGWEQHTWGSAIGDYMYTSQSAFNNSDGSTSFWNYSSSNRLTCDVMESNELTDGTLGRNYFYEARGYTVTDCYNQKTDNNFTGGFSFAQFKTEIDAGRPVLLNLAGHSVVGVGYDDSSNLVYIHDTWDYDTHTMTWGGSYSGMTLQSVSIVNIEEGTLPPPTATTGSATDISTASTTLNATVNPNGASTTVTFEYGATSSYGNTVTATQSPLTGTTSQSASKGLTGLDPNTTYHYRVKGTNSAGTTYGENLSLTTSYSSTLYVSADGECGQYPCYETIQLALEAADDGSLIKVAAGTYLETPNWKKAGTVAISGGWNSSFTEHNGVSEIYNPLASGAGTVKLRPNFKVVPQ